MKLHIVLLAAAALALSACGSDKSANEGSGNARPVVDRSNDRQVATTTAPVATYAPGSQEELNATIGDRVFFETDRYDLSQEARATVGFWADWMQKHSNVRIMVEGHADERGTREYNLALGARRANAVRDYLVALGVSGGRVQTVSFGKERPAVLGSNPDAWSQNRRSVVVVQ